jgi:hypothetical protein
MLYYTFPTSRSIISFWLPSYRVSNSALYFFNNPVSRNRSRSIISTSFRTLIILLKTRCRSFDGRTDCSLRLRSSRSFFSFTSSVILDSRSSIEVAVATESIVRAGLGLVRCRSLICESEVRKHSILSRAKPSSCCRSEISFYAQFSAIATSEYSTDISLIQFSSTIKFSTTSCSVHVIIFVIDDFKSSDIIVGKELSAPAHARFTRSIQLNTRISILFNLFSVPYVASI